MTNYALTMIDLFSGCGGVTAGFKNAGFKTIAAVEIDSAAAQTYKLNHPKVILYEKDIRILSPETMMTDCKLDKNQLTVLSACAPCQPFSVLNHSRKYDTRSPLVLEIIRFAEKLYPWFLFMENVPGLKKSPIFENLTSTLEKIGYKIIYAVVNAADYGVPQARKRLILLATVLDVDLKIPEPTHFPPEKAAESGKQRWLTVRDAFVGLEDLKSGEASKTDPMHIARNHSDLVLKRLEYIPHDGGDKRNLPPELRLPRDQNKITSYSDVYARMYFDRPAPTITSGCTVCNGGRFTHPIADRAITPREAARLQSFPDSYRFFGSRDRIASQIGNAVPVKLAEVFACYFRNLCKF